MDAAASSLPGLNVQMPQSTVDAAKMAKNTKDVHQAAVKFEALFMNEMLSHMTEGMKFDGQFDGGHGEEVFQSMLHEQYGKIIAESGQTGLSGQIEKEMLRMQEEQSNPRSKSGTNYALKN